MNNLPPVTFSAAYSSREPSSLTLAAAGLPISAIRSLFIFENGLYVFNAEQIDLLSGDIMQFPSVIARKQALILFI